MDRAVFFDRDGILNEVIQRDGGYYSPRDYKQFKLINIAKDITKYTHSLGFKNIVISNQPDISRGHLNKDELKKMTDFLYDELILDDVFYCMHDDDDLCECRKPLPGLFLLAKKKWNIDLNSSYMIGDSWKDIEAAKLVNVDSFLLDTVYNSDYNYSRRLNNLNQITNYLGNQDS